MHVSSIFMLSTDWCLHVRFRIARVSVTIAWMVANFHAFVHIYSLGSSHQFCNSVHWPINQSSTHSVTWVTRWLMRPLTMCLTSFCRLLSAVRRWISIAHTAHCYCPTHIHHSTHRITCVSCISFQTSVTMYTSPNLSCQSSEDNDDEWVATIITVDLAVPICYSWFGFN